MRIGISVAHCDQLTRPAAVVAAVRAAEQLGYASVWVSDSLLDPAAVLSAAAAVSSTVLLGAGIVVDDRADPAALARSVATVDRLSEGRLTVALGGPAGAIDTVLDALAGGGAPVLLDGRSPELLELVARRAAGWSPTGLEVAELAPGWAEVRRLWATHGRVAAEPRLVVRAGIVLLPAPAGAGRASYQGDAVQVAGDVVATSRMGADEVVLRLAGDLSLDQTLDGYARIAEAAEAAGLGAASTG